ncbi:MAG: type II secretion system protein GspG [Armatimonadetes bacterium]|jgi:type II secretion system protein G|nr:type II secretion system protein GspG [Armatimonadota bacterium]MDI9583448.1 type II secretion system protein GspG [Acidobacteriota bacterium]
MYRPSDPDEMTFAPPRRRRASRARYIVAGIVLLSAAFVGLQLGARQPADPRAVTVDHMRAIEDALDRYAVDNGGLLPADGEQIAAKNRQGLAALLERPKQGTLPPNWRGPYLPDETFLLDGWGQPFHYVSPGSGDPPNPYELWSWGSDNALGGSGLAADMRSWEPATLAL